MIGGLIRKTGKIWADFRTANPIGRDRFRVLRDLVRRAAATEYGRAHGFTEIAGSDDIYAAFTAALPVIDYDDWVSWLGEKSPVNKAVPLVDVAWPGRIDTFCLSSGTTSGRTKYVPYSREMMAVNRKAAIDMFAHALAVRPELTPPLTKTLYMSGSTRLTRNPNGVLCGDMSALTKYLAPKLLASITLPPRAISDTEPWSARLELLVDLCLREPGIGTLSGIPIWQLTLLEAIAERAGKPIAEVLPRLRLLIHGGMSVLPYRDRLHGLLGDEVTMLETYAASETGITAFTLPGEQGMRFWEHYDVFYELEGPEGEIITADRAATGVSYALIVSTCSGLWRYRIGDRVVFSSIDPLIIDHVTRDKTTSAFDEKVTEKQLELAMAGGEPVIADFALGSDTDAHRHVWFLITETRPEPAWLTALDDRLRATNEDYDDYRGDGRIKAPTTVAIADRGAFLAEIGRAEGGQRKFPRLLSPDETRRLLTRFDR